MALRLFRAAESQRVDGVERDADGRVWCRLFPRGTWHRADFPGGALTLDDAFFGALVASWDDAGRPALPIDYHHEEQDVAAGWVEGLRVAPGGLEGAVRWTPQAAAHIKADEYRYLSPTWSMSHTSRRTGKKAGPWLHGAALLNDPFFNEMPRVAAGSTHDAREGTNQERRMELLKRLCLALGLPEDTSEEKVFEALESLRAACAPEKKGEEMPEGEPMAAGATKATKLRAALDAATAEMGKLAARVATLEAEKAKAAEAIFERDVADLLKSAKAGLPAMADMVRAHAKALGLESAQKLVASLPDVPTAPAGIDAAPEAQAQDATAFEASVATKLKSGLSVRDAYRAATAEMPDAAAKAFTLLTTTR